MQLLKTNQGYKKGLEHANSLVQDYLNVVLTVSLPIREQGNMTDMTCTRSPIHNCRNRLTAVQPQAQPYIYKAIIIQLYAA